MSQFTNETSPLGDSSRYEKGSTVDMTTDSDLSSDISSLNREQSRSLGDFEIMGVIGHGKFSTVFRAKSKATGEVVALKKVQIFEIMDSRTRNDCINEVKILQSLDHPNIIKYQDSFMEENELIIVLQLAEEGDLGRILQGKQGQGEQLDQMQALQYFVQVCDALQHMHERRMMHRDIKPSNVFITADGKLKLGDLGLSRYFSSKTAQAQSMVGTPYYMSPECIRGQPYDWKSDVWSLGCLLYEMITLRGPFFRDGLNYYTLGKLISKCEYEPLPDYVMGELRELVSRMIQGAPDQRPSVSEVAGMAYAALGKLQVEAGGGGGGGGFGGGGGYH